MTDEVRCEWCGILLRYAGKGVGNRSAYFSSDRPQLFDRETRLRHLSNGLIWAACEEHIEGIKMADQKKDVKKSATNDPDQKRQEKIAKAAEKKKNRKQMRRGAK